MPHVLSLRDVTVNSILGHAARVTARVPKLIPKEIVPEALQQGCVLCGPSGEALDPTVEAKYLARPAAAAAKKEDDELELEQDPETEAPPADVVADALEVIRQAKLARANGASSAAEPKAPPPARAPEDPAAYKAAVVTAIKNLIVEGDVKNFKQDGTPTQRAIDRVAGFKVDPLVLIEAMAEVNVSE